jgi:hypothetical protein
MCDGLLPTTDAAKLAFVRPATIRKWVQRGHLTAESHDDLGRPLYRVSEVLRVERETRRRRPVGARHDYIAS